MKRLYQSFLLSLLFCLLLSLLVCCQKNQDQTEKLTDVFNLLKIEEVNDFILKKLISHRIILLGEGRHYEKLYRQKFIEFLYFWLDKIETNETTLKKLVLIYESTKTFSEKLNSFFKNGIIHETSYIPEYITDPTVADLEFYFDLKDFIDQIVILNNNKYSNNPINFKVFCVERDVSERTKEERLEYLRTERDIYTADKIIAKLNDFPDYKFIVYCGENHVRKKKGSRR